MKIKPEEHPILYNKKLESNKAYDEKITQIYFETYNFPAIYASLEGHLVMYASGHTTGISIISGHKQTEIYPIFLGYPTPCSNVTTKTGGNTVSNFLSNLMRRRGIVIEKDFYTNNQLSKNIFGKTVIDDLKEKFVEILNERPNILKSSDKSNQKYELPCGKIIKVGCERFLSGEVLFDTSIDVESDISEQLSIPEAVHKSINLCDIDVRTTLLKNLIVCGGNSFFGNFKERLKREVQFKFSKNSLWLKNQKYNKNSLLSCLPRNMVEKIQEGEVSKVNIKNSVDKYPIWLGGSILSSLTHFQQHWITKWEWDEVGTNAIKNVPF
eukprot:TRINITY_DN7962_c0_g1_i1.p1 TRINITY_DN7962_c0_g1~~TRINITY_DN7962_c0_g1_i1.p1  ORF type:complete len:381 (+),score=98.12 TRINITY_DN7962_c0_g1_i1:171-1145(+)